MLLGNGCDHEPDVLTTLSRQKRGPNWLTQVFAARSVAEYACLDLFAQLRGAVAHQIRPLVELRIRDASWKPAHDGARQTQTSPDSITSYRRARLAHQIGILIGNTAGRHPLEAWASDSFSVSMVHEIQYMKSNTYPWRIMTHHDAWHMTQVMGLHLGTESWVPRSAFRCLACSRWVCWMRGWQTSSAKVGVTT